MKAAYIVMAIALLGSECSRRDPIDRLMTELSHEGFTSYIFFPIELSKTASPQECIAVLTTRGNLSNPQFLEVRQLRDSLEVAYTAVLLNTTSGRKIVLLRPDPPSKSGRDQWYFRIYDAK